MSRFLKRSAAPRGRQARPCVEALEDRCLLSNSPLAIDAERSLTSPTAWYVYTGVTADFLTNTIQQKNLRITDLEVNSNGPTFTATLVQNTGNYAKAWWWYYGLTADQLSADISANQARLIDLDMYTVGGQERFAAVMVDNTGSAAKSWWWYYGESPSFIDSTLKANNARLIDLSFTDVNGARVYNAVMASNTGSDATAWWYYYNQTPNQVTSLLNQNQARLIDIEAEDPGHFDVVMVQNPGNSERWWWYYGKSIQDVVNTGLRNGARVFDIEPYSDGGQTVYAALMVDNVNALTDRVGDILRGANNNGQVGLYLKQVGGPVLADLNSNMQFEPASMIKVVLYLTALEQVQAGKAKLTQNVNWYYQPGDNLNTPTTGNKDVNPDSFSDTAANQITEPLGEVLDRMMKVSDNRATRAIDKLFGRTLINSVAQQLGMNDTVFASTLGSGVPGNYLTLYDAALLYEKVESGQLLKGEYLTDFRRLMTNETNQDRYSLPIPPFGGGVFGSMVTVVQQEASKLLNKPLNDPAVITLTKNFVAQMKNNWKGGGYDLYDTDAGHAHIDRTVGGWVQLPFKTRGIITPRSYVYGIFIDNALVTRNGSSDAGPELNAVNNAWANSQGELLREPIRQALASWLGIVD
jgi:beta-lactamase class A